MATVGVFGTWRALPGSEIYDQAEEIGRISGEAGYSVLTGGYSGVMEAAPRGAKSVAGQTLGYTWVGLDGDLEPNGFLDETRHFDSVVERLACLIEDSDICVFFPGRTGDGSRTGVGYGSSRKGALTSPLVLVGCYWKSFFNWLEKSNQKLGLPTGDEDEACIYRVIEKPVHFEAFLGDRR